MEVKECTKCHLVKPLTEFYKSSGKQGGYRAYCKLCCNAQSRANYQADPAKRIAQTSAYQRERPDKVREYGYRYKTAHPGRRAEIDRRYKQKHADRVRAYRRTDVSRQAIRRCQQAKPEQYRAKAREWDRTHPDKVIAKAHRRRFRVRANGGSFTAQEWADLKAKYNYTCLCCGRREPEILLTPDHVIPVLKGGPNDISNIQPLCGPCNSRKHTKTTDFR